MSSAKVTGLSAPASYTDAQTRVIETAVSLFAEHGVSGTSLQMIADALGVTKAAVYHQYHTKDEIVLAVGEVVLAGLEATLTTAEAERSRARARDVLVVGLIDLAVKDRHTAFVLQRDPVMLRFLSEHAPFLRVMERLNHVLMGGASGIQARVLAATIIAVIGGAVMHPLVFDLDERNLRSELLKQTRKLLPTRG